jgi:hypothetical protein
MTIVWKSPRLGLAALAVLGLAVSVWSARPAHVGDVAGWKAAVLWASFGWILILALVPRAPVAAIVGGLLIAAAVEVLILVIDDPLLIVAKPMYQLPALFVCIYLGCFEGGKRGRSR